MCEWRNLHMFSCMWIGVHFYDWQCTLFEWPRIGTAIYNFLRCKDNSALSFLFPEIKTLRKHFQATRQRSKRKNNCFIALYVTMKLQKCNRTRRKRDKFWLKCDNCNFFRNMNCEPHKHTKYNFHTRGKTGQNAVLLSFKKLLLQNNYSLQYNFEWEDNQFISPVELKICGWTMRKLIK